MVAAGGEAGRGWWAAAAVYAALAVAWAAPSSLSPADTVPDLGDPLHLAYVMAWDAHQLVRRPWALYESNSFYPYPRSLAFGDHLLPEALLAAPVNWTTGNAVLASNVGVVLALWLSALSMFALVREATGRWGAGLLAGLAYAFNSFTQHELLRVHVLNLQWWPLGLLFLWRFVRGRRGRDAWLFAAALALQGLSGTYYLLYTLLLAPLWVAGLYGLARRLPGRAELRALGLAVASVAAPSAVLLLPYLAHFRVMGFEKSWSGGADVLSYLDPPPGGWLLGSIELLPRHSEVPHFLGFAGALLVLIGAAAALARKGESWRLGCTALATAALGFALSLGPAVLVGGRPAAPGPYKLLYDHVPLVRGMASPERLGVLVILGGAVLAGLAAARLLDPLGPRARAAALTALAVCLPLEHWTPPPPGAAVPTGAHVPEVYRWLARQGSGPVAELPLYSERTKRFRSAYLYFSTYHWRPIPIGRTSFYPPAHDYLAWHLRGFPDETSLTLLARMGVRTLVVHPQAWDDAARPERLSALDASPRLRLLNSFEDSVDPRFERLRLGGERVYALEWDPPAPSAACEPADEVPREGWSFEHSGRKRPERVRDGDVRTSWFTHVPQRPGDFFDVILPRQEVLAAVVQDLYYPHEEFPRNLQLFVSDDRESWARAPDAEGPDERWAVLDALLHRPREARLVWRLPPRPARSLSLRIGAREHDDAWPQWSIAELRLYRACR